MNGKEAIERLILHKGWGFSEGTMTALDMAIKALEKQVPKKVILEDDGDVLLCPSCGIDFMGSMSDPDHDPYYCFECGQALDWKVDKE